MVYDWMETSLIIFKHEHIYFGLLNILKLEKIIVLNASICICCYLYLDKNEKEYIFLDIYFFII
jgi:hypothetical protein